MIIYIFILSIQICNCRLYDGQELNATTYYKQQEPQQVNSTTYYNQTQIGGKSNSLNSPYITFLQDDELTRYYSQAKIITNYKGEEQSSIYKLAIDINIPFIFVVEQQGLQNQLHYTKMIPTEEQISLLIQYIKPKFTQIEAYSSDIFYVLNCSFWINDYLGIDIGFFYLMGFGATDFQKSTQIDGFIGLGKKPEFEKTQLNYLMTMRKKKIIDYSSYALYYGNQPGFFDSIFYLGGYQEMFKMNGSKFQEIKILPGCNQTWCFRVNQLSLFRNNTQIFSSQKSYTSYISSTYPLILIPKEIADGIQFHIQQDEVIECEFRSQEISGKNNTILICSTKLEISIQQTFPTIEFRITQKNQNILIILQPQQYIQKCLDDVETYAFKCFTYFAIYDEKIDLYQPTTDIIFGLPILRVYYTYYDLQNQTVQLTQAYQYENISPISRFWYYSFLALLICWAMVMMSCGLFFKDQMDQMIIFVINILKYMQGDQEARQQVLRNYLTDD